MMNHIKKIISSFFIPTVYVSPFSSDLKDKVIIITGASRGIGKTISEVLYREGAQLILISRDIESAKHDKDELYKSDRVLLINANVSEEVDVEKIKNIITDKYKKIDVLINNAGQFADKAIEELSVSDYKKVIDTNIFGIFLMSRMVTPFMKKQKNGYIINIGSKISHNTNVSAHKVLYATSKYAVEGFSFALNKELKEFGGILIS
jgi:3-oxoacyl-[acyl-carrier protein] reductase